MESLNLNQNLKDNADPPCPIHGSKRSPTADCYNARKRHKTTH